VVPGVFHRWFRGAWDKALTEPPVLEPDPRGGAVETGGVKVAIDKPELSPRELAWHITDTEGHPEVYKD
jgi:hypothetical protein